jgi:hypothetical protein
MPRPKKAPAEKKSDLLFFRADGEMASAFRRYCAEVHGEAPSVVLRGLVREAIRKAGYVVQAKVKR